MVLYFNDGNAPCVVKGKISFEKIGKRWYATYNERVFGGTVYRYSAVKRIKAIKNGNRIAKNPK